MPVEIPSPTNQFSLERPGRALIARLGDLCIDLDGNDLIELCVRRSASQISGSHFLMPGALSFPFSRVAEDESLRVQLDDATASGRFIQKVKGVSRYSKGNIVLQPVGPPDITVSEALADVSRGAIEPVLQFVQDANGQVSNIKLFPNASQGKLNGVAVQMRPKDKRWWKVFGRLKKFPIGRGMLLAPLHMNADEYIEREPELMETIRQIGLMQKGAVKYISMLYGEPGDRMYMAIAGGPSGESVYRLIHDLELARSSQDAEALIANAIQSGEVARNSLFETLTREIGVGGEVMTNVPYISANISGASLVSGGINPDAVPAGNGIGVFTVGDEQLMIYSTVNHPGTNPLGVKLLASERERANPHIPDGVRENEPGAALVGSIDRDKLLAIVEPTDTLTTLSIPHHSSWRRRPKYGHTPPD